ncbi:MAG TPA: M23 family metallopeptidase [Chitinophaga sp.]|uniref:M23 family metallopeptidase n=1 Tax=Chitinophaga sp. TaxID=1869181 RepID=UPI002C46800D|nr:M23 family metallopeptidase [Chitinophaga sp.]HVI43375.1 M23 family metallopeptidase [Chitinophaga sp.]
MIIYTLLFITLALSAYSLSLLWKSSRKPLSKSYSSILLGLSLGLFLFLFGTWVYLSIYAKYTYGGLLILSAAAGLIREKQGGKASPAKWKQVSNLILSVVLIICNVLYFTGTTGNLATITLDYPLKSGKYFVLQGGKGLPTNVFHFSLRGAVYAMDIVKLNKWGGRANRIFSKRLEDYEIFNDTVYAPCDGLVLRAYSTNPDNIPPAMERGPKNTNQVLLEGKDCYFFAAHLKMNGVFVKEGQYVKTGDPLGLVGNSGFSTEPHLHIQTHAKTPGVPWYQAKPLYMLFKGKGYLLNEEMNIP